jgi:hypothetical protein
MKVYLVTYQTNAMDPRPIWYSVWDTSSYFKQFTNFHSIYQWSNFTLLPKTKENRFVRSIYSLFIRVCLWFYVFNFSEPDDGIYEIPYAYYTSKSHLTPQFLGTFAEHIRRQNIGFMSVRILALSYFLLFLRRMEKHKSQWIDFCKISHP